MYPGPAPGITPTFVPWPPNGQSTGPITGEPVMPSPTTGSSSVKIRPTFFGQPGRYGLGPLTVGPPGSPSGSIANSRLLPKSSWPVCASSASEAVLSDAGVDAAVVVGRVLLVGADHDLRLAVARQVAHRGRVDDRALVEVRAGRRR